MNIVADTNIFLAVSLNEAEKARIVDFTNEASIFAPEILPYETGNAFSAMVKRNKLTKPEALEAESITNLIPVRLVGVDIHESLRIAVDHDIYAYDAYFLQCAKAYSFPLLTLDKRMRQVAEQLGIQLLG
jgi:predicted nucleic acid-binding protein